MIYTLQSSKKQSHSNVECLLKKTGAKKKKILLGCVGIIRPIASGMQPIRPSPSNLLVRA
jgi:hypothetical protein